MTNAFGMLSKNFLLQAISSANKGNIEIAQLMQKCSEICTLAAICTVIVTITVPIIIGVTTSI